MCLQNELHIGFSEFKVCTRWFRNTWTVSECFAHILMISWWWWDQYFRIKRPRAELPVVWSQQGVDEFIQVSLPIGVRRMFVNRKKLKLMIRKYRGGCFFF